MSFWQSLLRLAEPLEIDSPSLNPMTAMSRDDVDIGDP